MAAFTDYVTLHVITMTSPLPPFSRALVRKIRRGHEGKIYTQLIVQVSQLVTVKQHAAKSGKHATKFNAYTVTCIQYADVRIFAYFKPLLEPLCKLEPLF